MLGINSNKSTQLDTSAVNLIGIDTKIIGDINCSGDIRIDGQLTGNLTTTGKFILGISGSITGNVISKNADISGQINGEITTEELLTLKNTAKIFGDIFSEKLSIEPGAVFTGSCKMESKLKNIVQSPNTMNEKTKFA